MLASQQQLQRCSTGLIELDQIPARVREHRDRGWSGARRRLRERHTESRKPRVFCLNIVALERGRRDALLEQGFLKGLARWIGVRLQRELEIIEAGGRDRKPSVLADRDLVLLLEAEHFGVEAQGL